MEQLSLFPIEEKVERAVQNLKMFEAMALRMHPEGYYLAFSGGKDSQVIYQLAKMAGVKFTAHYHVTTVDPPELVRFIRREYPKVHIERPETTMWQLIVQKGFPPTRRVRYCCSELKERGGEGCFVITGVRWSESRNRKNRGLAEISGTKSADIILLNNDNDEKRRLIEDCQIQGKRVLNPIIDWSEEEVWRFIHQYVHTYCELYDQGFTRLGCVGCPLASVKKREKELKRYPHFRRAYLKTFERMLEAKERTRVAGNRWETAEDVYAWWMYGNEKTEEQVPGQFLLNLLPERRKVNGETKIEGKTMEGKTMEEWRDLYRRRFASWQYVYDYGDWGQMWTDGISLNMIRLELLEIQTVLRSYGEKVTVPQEMPESYMAGAEAIRRNAADSLKAYLESEEYRYLCEMENCFTDAQQKKTRITVTLGAIRGLEAAVEKDDLVMMREMGEAGRFTRTLADAAEQTRRYALKCKEKETKESTEDWQLDGQMSIFDLAA